MSWKFSPQGLKVGGLEGPIERVVFAIGMMWITALAVYAVWRLVAWYIWMTGEE